MRLTPTILAQYVDGGTAAGHQLVLVDESTGAEAVVQLSRGTVGGLMADIAHALDTTDPESSPVVRGEVTLPVDALPMLAFFLGYLSNTVHPLRLP